MYGIIILIGYFALMMGVTWLFTEKSKTKEDFYVGDRKIGTLKAALSIAATWIWAPSLFVSAEKSYSNGFAGIFWFLVPNVLCLLIFIPFAKKIRKELPEGITLSGYMKGRYSERVKNIYLVELIGLATMSTVVQLVAGSKMLSAITGMPFWIITIILALLAYSYSQYSGIKASVTTDNLQIIIILGVSAMLVFGTLRIAGVQTYISGLGGIGGNYRNLLSAGGKEVFWTFGLSTTIGLLSGPFGDQTFWQRTFAIDENKIGKSFALGALIFALVPLSMSLIGFVAAGKGFIPNDTGMVNFELAQAMFPQWVVWLFVLMLLSGLLSTVDSNLCSMPTLINDIKKNYSLADSKKTMILYLILTVLIANIPGLTVTTLFLFYGTLRASTMFTTVLTLKGVKLKESGVFYGVIASLILGVPTFAMGSILNITALKVAGSLLALLLSGTIALILSKKGVKVA